MNLLKQVGESFRDMTRFERILWISSILIVTAAFVLSGSGDWLNLIASIIGVTAVIFVSKGYALGQFLIIVFAVFYGIISFYFTYYGEMITYLGMTAPIAAAALVSWLRHPFKDSKTVTVAKVSRRNLIILSLLAAAVTIAFYFILGVLGNANLLVSTISVTTSFCAAALTVLRSAAYAIWYAANDGVLIVLWILASLTVPSYMPMVVCFTMFFINDLYGFYNWRRMGKMQMER